MIINEGLNYTDLGIPPGIPPGSLCSRLPNGLKIIPPPRAKGFKSALPTANGSLKTERIKIKYFNTPR